MDFLGIGFPELLLIAAIMLIVLGPREMVNTGRQAGRLIRKIIHSDAWRSMMSASREIREVPTRLVRESGLDADLAELRRQTRETFDPIRVDPSPSPKIAPPRTTNDQPVDAKGESVESPTESDPSQSSPG